MSLFHTCEHLPGPLGYPTSSLSKLSQQLREALAVVVLTVMETEAQKAPASQRAAASEGGRGRPYQPEQRDGQWVSVGGRQPCVLEEERERALAERGPWVAGEVPVGAVGSWRAPEHLPSLQTPPGNWGT